MTARAGCPGHGPGDTPTSTGAAVSDNEEIHGKPGGADETTG